MTDHPDEVVRRARVIASRGDWSYAEIRRHLADEGHIVSRDQLINWILWRTRQDAGGPLRNRPASRTIEKHNNGEGHASR